MAAVTGARRLSEGKSPALARRARAPTRARPLAPYDFVATAVPGGVIVEMLTVLFRWPLLPVRGLIGLAQLLRDQAEREFHDPAAVRRLLEEAAGARDSGELSDEEVSRLEHQAVSRLIRPSTGEVR